MIEETDFETYLFVSKKKFEIFLLDKKNLKNLYYEELVIDNNYEDLNDLSKFLDKNFYKIERLVGSFIKNIILIIKNEENLQASISFKKKSYEGSINRKFLENNLIELKDLFKENYLNHKIMHMVIVNYIVNEKKHSFLDNSISGEYLGLEVNFIAIENSLVFALDKVLEKYQTQVSQYMCGDYIKNFFNEDEDSSELSEMASKIKDGLNSNEVILVPKNIENKGFFEKFFQLFN
jgi:hypothetical protein